MNQEQYELLQDIKKMGSIIGDYQYLTEWDVKSNKRFIYEYEHVNWVVFYRLMNKKELYECAKDNRIPSRSHMRKKQLIQALVNL